MRLLLMFLLFVGVVLVIVNEMVNKPKQIVHYKYLPRDLDTYLREEPYASITFADMFADDFEPATSYASLSNVVYTGNVGLVTSNNVLAATTSSRLATKAYASSQTVLLNSPMIQTSSTIM